MQTPKKKRLKKIIFISGGIIALILATLLIVVNAYLEPLLRSRLHTLIVEGSDSLYTYKLGKLNANLFGGKVEVVNFEISIDSTRYKLLENKNALPALTMQLNMRQGHLKGIGIISLVFGKQINISEIQTRDADIKLSRRAHKEDSVVVTRDPLWKSIQPKINSISIDRIKLTGIKLLYKDSDTAESAQLQFNRCDALLEDIRIDSTSAADTSRIGFMQYIFFDFDDLRFQTKDSVYKMIAGRISYSSKARQLSIDSFKLQPTMKPAAFAARDSIQRTLYTVLFDKVVLKNIRIDRFIRNDLVEADSIIFLKPQLSIYFDGSLPLNYESKIGKYPHEHLLKVRSAVAIKNIHAIDLHLDYTQRKANKDEEGSFSLDHINLSINNITNVIPLIKINPICTVRAYGLVLGSSPVDIGFKLYLDSSNGRFDATGSIKNISHNQINAISKPLANVEVKSLQIEQLNFQISGEDFSATANVQMRYKNMSVVFHKTNEETGATETQKFLTNLFNRIILPDNPGEDGVERTANQVMISRLTTQSFFGLIWKAIFAGMQNIILKS